MFVNMKNINLNDFKSMCRTCIDGCNLKPIKDKFIIEVLHNITDINFEDNDILPQQICETCVKKIRDIHAFAFQCIEIDLTLKKCLETDLKQIKEEITIDEHDLKIKDELEEIKEISLNQTRSNNQINFDEIVDLNFDQNVMIIDETSNSELLLPLNINETQTDKWFEATNDINYSYITYSNNGIVSDAESDKSLNLNIVENVEQENTTNIKQETKIKTNNEKCDKCKRYFPKTKIEQHMKKYHEIKQCSICNLQFDNVGLFYLHQQIHVRQNNDDKNFLCEICAKRYKSKRGLDYHISQYAGKSHYNCDICQQTFSAFSRMEAHRKYHKWKKTLQCDLCSKVFNKVRQLRQHKQNMHEKKQCDLCPKIFDNRSMRIHKKSHK